MGIYRADMYIDDDKLYDYAANTAKLISSLREDGCIGAAGTIKRAYHGVRKCHDEISRRYASVASPPKSCDWIMDNFYMVQREYASVLPSVLRASYVRSCAEGLLPLYMCRTLLLCSGGAVSEKRLSSFLTGFQSVLVLRRSELELIPAMLPAAIIINLSEILGEMRSSAEPDSYADSLEALFSTLRLFSVIDTAKLISKADVPDRILRSDPTGEYGKMDSGTRQAYLRRLQQLARKERLDEHIYASRLIEKAREQNVHIGTLLFEQKDGSGGLYICANILLTLFIAFLPGFAYRSFLSSLLLILPVSELVKALIDFTLSRFVKAKRLFRMETENGIPPEGKTIVVVSALIGDIDGAERLEQLYHACKSEGRALSFGLLADLPAAQTQELPEDAAALAKLRRSVAGLNLKYGNRFYLFTRKRRFDGEKFTPHERKRGAITELAKLLCEKENELAVTGDKDALAGTKYILTLDSDTLIYPGSIGELVGAILHPLNRPVVDRAKKRVVAGHAVIHPHIDTELRSACETDFALIFAGSGGCDPYGTVAGELYMDAFGSGGFAGKGLIDAHAFLECTGDFPEGRILSHDAPEGAVLRGAYMGDAEFSDAFPFLPLAWYKRLHRWIRGDWQNIAFIFAPDLRDIDRWRLFDNLRRSLIAPATFIAILAGLFGSGIGLRLAAGAAVLSLLSGLLLSMLESSMKHREHIPLRRHTRLLSGMGGAMIQAFIRLWLLPYEAWVYLSAIVTALWRMLVSRKKLLQWQTAAASLGETGFAAHVRAMWPAVLIGVVLMALCESVMGKSAGLMWLLSPAAAAALALPSGSIDTLPDTEKDYLREASRRSYKYFSTFFTPEDNFLPPDNFQEQPPVGLAHRTSPTNISLALCSAVSGCDMGFLSPADTAESVERIIETLEKMPRCKGHFYNWYNTRTLTPLTPAFISTVDSGNLYAGLVVAKEAMLEANELSLAMRIAAIMEKMDFSFLFDRERRLFHICYDTVKEQGTGGWYDLMASEAMLTSYIAIAKGDVPVKHWRRLSRAQLQKDGYRGLASWTGTMFEYLMPELFLPIYRGSLLYESGRFCVYVQKRRVWAGKPWGISESAFYSLDSAMNYRYKAHGCDALSLKRGQDEDTVISPYSSFLALAIDAESSIRNMRRLEAFGALGRFGFIEALDFTPERCRSSCGEQVRCYMAHHIGMSITAAANAACGGSIRRRFMASPDMGAFAMLLQERLPESAAVIKKESADIPERIDRGAVCGWTMRGGAEDTLEHCCVLSNGAYSIMSTNRGRSKAVCGPVTVYDADASDCGWETELEINGRCEKLIPAERCDMWEMNESSVSFSGRAAGILYGCTIGTACGECGEKRTVTLRADSDRELRLRFRLTPILAPIKSYAAHTAFRQLGICSQASGNTITIRRLRRPDCPELWLSVACDAPIKFDGADGGSVTWYANPVISGECSVSLTAGKEKAISFSMCISTQMNEAFEGCQRILVSECGEYGSLVSAAAAHLKMSSADISFAMKLLKRIWRGTLHGAAAKKALWQYGISGDFPLVCCDGRSSELERVIKCFCLLKSCQVEAECVVFSDEQGEYRQPVFQKLSKMLSGVSLESLINTAGGVHLVPISAVPEVMSRSVYSLGAKEEKRSAIPSFPYSAPRAPWSIPAYSDAGLSFDYYINSNLPARPWQLVMSNGSFGYIAADCGSGYMWLDNAREMRIDPPPCDALSTHGNEMLWLERNGEKISLFAANDGYACSVSFSPALAVWEKDMGFCKSLLKAFVPEDVNARVFTVEGCEGQRLRWRLLPVMGAADSASVQFFFDGRSVRITNPESYYDGAVLTLTCSMPMQCSFDYEDNSVILSLVADKKTVLVCGIDRAERLSALCEDEACAAAAEKVSGAWRALLSRFSLSCGLEPLDGYMGGWCLYQIIACRLRGRASLYQSGGAIGFRDQLQDAVNLILFDFAYARERIIDCCMHQYTQGDVMHWWHAHPDGDMGIRTRCSDDLLWLCWAVCEYCEKTGDYAICEQVVPYIDSPALKDGEDDRYEKAVHCAQASVIDHAIAALECCMRRGLGEHGLPRFGSGDWNDALSEVGGESVWLGWFASSCAVGMARLCEHLGMSAHRYKKYGVTVAAAAESAWSGRWYLRGYFPDGEALGGGDRIDSVAQSWAILSDAHTPSPRASGALDAALHRLVDRKNSLIKLFDPPYSGDERNAGYISSYGEGFRENGGQYTHGAIWLAMACFRLGRSSDGWDILRMLLPESHDMQRYKAEPFVLSADVYSAPGHEGEAGWTWYTGSAAWYFRAVYESMLGFTLHGGALTLSPRLPSDFPDCKVRWTSPSGTAYDIEVRRDGISVNGKEYNGEKLT